MLAGCQELGEADWVHIHTRISWLDFWEIGSRGAEICSFGVGGEAGSNSGVVVPAGESGNKLVCWGRPSCWGLWWLDRVLWSGRC